MHWLDSIAVHKHNKPNSFTVNLPLLVKLEGQGEVPVIDFKLKSPTKTPVYLLSDICTSNYVCGSLLPVLRGSDTCFNYPNFIKVNNQQIQSIKIFIKSSLMQEVEVSLKLSSSCFNNGFDFKGLWTTNEISHAILLRRAQSGLLIFSFNFNRDIRKVYLKM